MELNGLTIKQKSSKCWDNQLTNQTSQVPNKANTHQPTNLAKARTGGLVEPSVDVALLSSSAGLQADGVWWEWRLGSRDSPWNSRLKSDSIGYFIPYNFMADHHLYGIIWLIMADLDP